MIIPIDPKAKKAVACPWECDKDGNPLPDATIFHLRIPTLTQRKYLADRSARVRTDAEDDERALEIRMGFTTSLRLKFALTKPENYGAPWEDEPDLIDEQSGRRLPTNDFIASIPDNVATFLNDEITAMLTCSEAEVGKSESSSEQPSRETPE